MNFFWSNKITQLQSCSLHGTQNLSFTEHSVDFFVPTVFELTDCAPVTFPIYSNISYEDYQFVRDGIPPMTPFFNTVGNGVKNLNIFNGDLHISLNLFCNYSRVHIDEIRKRIKYTN